MFRNLVNRTPWILLSAGLGALAFVGIQNAALGGNITQFLGAQISTQGGYGAGAAPYIGWGVHLAVSLSYAALAAVILGFLPAARGRRYASMAVATFGLGWVTTLITAPAIAVTISVLAGKGLPAALPGLNTAFGVPFWNHVAFFAIAFAVFAVSELRGSRRARAQGGVVAAAV